MSQPINRSVVTTAANAWTKAFSSAQQGHRAGATARAYDTNSDTVFLARVPRGGTAPTSTPWAGDQSDVFASLSAGDNAYPMGALADSTVDLYVCARGGSAGQVCVLWEEV